MSKQDPRQRIKNFNSVALGLTKAEAQAEARRCLQCKQPLCIQGCPVEINIPAFIRLMAEGKFDRAAGKIRQKNSLPAICGRVCPQETQCECRCVLGKRHAPIAIGSLERFAADWQIRDLGLADSGKCKPAHSTRVAVVGSGPAGLTCAGDLAKRGYAVTVFESLHQPGGVLLYGIPEFRLPKKILQIEIDYIESLGVEVKTNVLIGKTVGLEELFARGYQAVFVATGAGLPQFLNIPGENLNRVYSANEFLTRTNLMQAYRFPEYDTPINLGRKVAVIGGGNVAFDAARCALRLGAHEVYIVYRRSEREMPARAEEVENAKEEGVELLLLTLPVKIIGNAGFCSALECLCMRLGEKDASGRRRPIPVAGSQFSLGVDTVIVAIGQRPNPLLLRMTPKLQCAKNGTIVVDQATQATNLKGVFAGGDITTGADTVISAMGAGKRAAKAIDKYLKN